MGRRFTSIALVVLTALAVAVADCGTPAPRLRLATTTSVDNSGLLERLLPRFCDETGIAVQVLAVGSGRALQLLRRGDADVALTHDPTREASFLEEMPAAMYRKVMYNDFVIVGPADDPVAVREAANAADAMRRIATSGVPFVSRGDESGTHAREQQLWQQAGVTPPAAQLLETGQGMAATLRIASERRGYTLTDRATFSQLAQTLALQVRFEHDPDLLNTYAVIVAGAGSRREHAMRFVSWLTDGDEREGIAAFSAADTRPFTVWPADRGRGTPDALPH